MTEEPVIGLDVAERREQRRRAVYEAAVEYVRVAATSSARTLAAMPPQTNRDVAWLALVHAVDQDGSW